MHHFVLAKLATSSIRVNNIIVYYCHTIVSKHVEPGSVVHTDREMIRTQTDERRLHVYAKRNRLLLWKKSARLNKHSVVYQRKTFQVLKPLC